MAGAPRKEMAASFTALGSRDSAAHPPCVWIRCCLWEFSFKPLSHEMQLVLASSAFGVTELVHAAAAFLGYASEKSLVVVSSI